MSQTNPDSKRKWFVMAAVAMGIFLGTIDGSIVNVALPTLIHSLNAEFAEVQWVVLSYLLVLSALVLTMGRLGDMMGKKPIYVTGFTIFTLGSALCGLSPTVYWLIGFRVLQAVGASMIVALGMAILTEAFPSSERGKALGISGTVVSIGIVVGPTLGGLIIDAMSWRWIFYVNLPIGLLGTLMAMRFVPKVSPPGTRRFDFLGALVLVFSLSSLLFALTIGQDRGYGDPLILGLFLTWFLLLAVFVLIELRIDEPMIDLRLFRNRLFRVNLGTGAIVFVCISGTTFLMPFFLEYVLGLPPRQVGMYMAVVPVALGLTAPIAGTLSDRWGTRRITVLGLGLLAGGYLAVSGLSTETDVVGYVLRFLPIGLGMGVFQSPNNSAIMGAAPRHRLGVASGLLSITRILGQIVGIAVMGSFWATRVGVHGGVPGGQAHQAPPGAQVSALTDTALLISVLIGLALLLGAWAMMQEIRDRRRAGAETS